MSLTTPGIRDLVEAIATPWLGDPNTTTDKSQPGDDGYWAQRFLYALWGYAGDAIVQIATEGTYARMPTRADPSALPYIGRDRQIVRGLGDTDASYALRLKGAIPAWRFAGSDRGVLSQMLGFISDGPMARAVSGNPTLNMATWRTYVPSGSGQDLTKPPATYRLNTNNWDWDSLGGPLPNGFWRWWPILYAVSPNDWCHPGPKWGAGQGWKWGDHTRAWGFDLPSSTYQTLRALLAQWKRAGSIAQWILVSFDSSLFDPNQPDDGVHNPMGDFGYWSKHAVGVDGITRVVPARFSNARYVDGALF